MGRGYDVAHLNRVVSLISKNFFDVAIGADVIVGFPGEGEREFSNTYNFIKENPFTHLHIFPYSPREGTTAYNLKDPVPKEVKKQRSSKLRKLISEKNYKFRKGLLHKTFNIIYEKSNSSGLTGNYIRIMLGKNFAPGRLIRVKLTELSQDHTYGIVE
jgi:threonylcarbamoyladenosine tRNA methylthiotransferase MtaB